MSKDKLIEIREMLEMILRTYSPKKRRYRRIKDIEELERVLEGLKPMESEPFTPTRFMKELYYKNKDEIIEIFKMYKEKL